MQLVLIQEAEKQQRLFGRALPSRSIWTDDEGKEWDASDIALAASRGLKHAGVAWFRRPYKLKNLSASALVAAGVARADVAKFIRHSPATENLDKFYVDDDLGCGVANKPKKIAAARETPLTGFSLSKCV